MTLLKTLQEENREKPDGLKTVVMAETDASTQVQST